VISHKFFEAPPILLLLSCFLLDRAFLLGFGLFEDLHSLLQLSNPAVELCKDLQILKPRKVVFRELKRIDLGFYIEGQIHLNAEPLKSWL
jgi:hypothetical protein